MFIYTTILEIKGICLLILLMQKAFHASVCLLNDHVKLARAPRSSCIGTPLLLKMHFLLLKMYRQPTFPS